MQQNGGNKREAGPHGVDKSSIYALLSTLGGQGINKGDWRIIGKAKLALFSNHSDGFT